MYRKKKYSKTSTSDAGPTLQLTSPGEKEREESATKAASSENGVRPSTKRGYGAVCVKESRRKKLGKSDEAYASDD